MGIVSYAQNLEDVMLWRALEEHGPGFWIDVGASDPTIHSVTRAFSEHGWRGINVEPRDEEFALLEQRRPNDINLRVAVGARPGRMTLYAFEDAGLSTLDAAVAARHRADGRHADEREVEVTTLAEICRRHVTGTVHFLKIDVEGAERQVLEGADFTACRPWIVLVESTVPLTRNDVSADWEPLLHDAGYRFGWFDGLNRFYIAAERWETLSRHFAVQPNIFDDYSVSASAVRPVEIEVELARARAEIDLLRLRLAEKAPRAGWSLRFFRRLRSFLSAELRMEVALLREEIARLGAEVRLLRRDGRT
jgi:FkbM family methyltransferase